MLGVMYALVAVGFTLFFGVLDVIHFSHGDIFMLGAFAGLTVLVGLKAAGLGGPLLALPLTFAVSILVTGLVGVAAERVCVKPLARASPLMTLLATLSLGLVIRESVLIFYPRGADPKPFPQLLPQGGFEVGGVAIRYESLVILGIGLAAMVAVDRVINRTKMGAAIRAVAQEPEAAQMMGVNLDRTVDATFFLGSGLAAVAGILSGLYYSEIHFIMGITGGVIGFSAAAIGGACALVRFVPRLGGALAGAFARRRPAALGAGVVLALALPLALRSSPYWTFVATLALLYVTIGQGLNLQIGTAGVINLAGAAFAGLGGYSVGLLTVAAGWPSWLAVLVGPWVAVAVGTILFVPILKTRGHYLALVTIAFVFIFNILMNNLEFTGGPQGIKNIPTLRLLGHAFTTKPVLAGVELPSHANFYYAALVMAGLTTWVLRRLHDSWLGLALNTLRDDEIAARCCGVSITRGKLLAFSIGNFFIGLGGAFYAVMVGFVSPPDFDFGYSLVMVSVIIIGGVDSIPGVVLGACLLVPLPERFRFLHEYRLLLYGVVIVVMLLYRPQGLWPAQVRRYR